MSSVAEKVLSGAEKVAILLRLLDEQALNAVMTQLDDEEIREISRALVSLGQVPSEVVEKIILEFIWQTNESVSVVGNERIATDMLRKSLGEERATKIIQEIKSHDQVSIWDHLEKMDTQDLTGFIKKEHPQTVAAILSFLSPMKSAMMLNILHRDYAFEIIKRIMTIDDLDKASISRLEAALHNQFSDRFKKDFTMSKNNLKVVADILDVFYSNNPKSMESEENFLTRIAAYDQHAADNIKKMMFSFADIATLDYSSIQSLLQHIDDKSVLAMALKGASEKIRQAFASGMSQRAAKLLLEEISTLSYANASDIRKAQQTIVTKAKELINNGVIVLKKVT